MNRALSRLAPTALALIGICTSTVVAAAPASRDLSLTNDGRLIGQVVSVQGQGVAGADVKLTTPNGRAVSTRADAEGQFSFAGVPAGVYQLTAVGRGGTVRVWTAAMAPPTAHDGVLIVDGDQIARGEFFSDGEGFSLAHPLTMTLIVAAAIAIPLALDDDNGS